MSTEFLSQPKTVSLRASTLESLTVELAASTDPTDTPPQFTVTDDDLEDPGDDATWVDGAWASGYGDAGIGWTTAFTPLVGNTGDFVLASGRTYKVWAAVTAGVERAVTHAGTIICP